MKESLNSIKKQGLLIQDVREKALECPFPDGDIPKLDSFCIVRPCNSYTNAQSQRRVLAGSRFTALLAGSHEAASAAAITSNTPAA